MQLLPSPSLQFSYLPSALSLIPHSISPPPCLVLFLRFLLRLPRLARSGFSNETDEITVPEVLNTLFRSFLSMSFVFRSTTSTLLHLSGSVDTLLYDLIALAFGLAHFHLLIFMLAAATSYSSERAYPLLNSHLPLSLSLSLSLSPSISLSLSLSLCT